MVYNKVLILSPATCPEQFGCYAGGKSGVRVVLFLAPGPMLMRQKTPRMLLAPVVEGKGMNKTGAASQPLPRGDTHHFCSYFFGQSKHML